MHFFLVIDFMPLMRLYHNQSEMHCNRISNERVIKQLMLMSSMLNLVDDSGNKRHIDNSGCKFVLESILSIYI